MKIKRKGTGNHSIVRIVVFGAVGIIALALGWLALNQNTEGRSKAAFTETVYKIWEFKNTAEGWVGENGTQLGPTPNVLYAVFANNATASLRNDLVKTALPYGNKYLKVILALGRDDVVRVLGITDNRGNTVDEVSNVSSEPGTAGGGAGSGIVDTDQGCQGPGCLSPDEIQNAQPIGWPDPNQSCSPRPSCLDTAPYCRIDEPIAGWCPPTPKTTCKPVPPCLYTSPYCSLELPPGNWCPTPTRKPTPQPGVTTFDLTIQYQLTGKTTWETVVKRGLVSKGSYAEYAVLLPGINPLSIGKLRLQVSGVSSQSDVISNYLLAIDRIWLTGPVPKPTPKPTCTPQPPCLYSPPYCKIDPKLPPGGWCPRVTPTPTILPIVPNKDTPALFDETPKKKGKHWTCNLFPNRSWCQ